MSSSKLLLSDFEAAAEVFEAFMTARDGRPRGRFRPLPMPPTSSPKSSSEPAVEVAAETFVGVACSGAAGRDTRYPNPNKIRPDLPFWNKKRREEIGS